MTSLSPQEAPRQKTRIARLFVPSDLKESPHLPSDSWIVSNAFDVFRSDKEIKRGFARLCGFAVLTALAVGAGIAGAIATAAAPPLSISLAVVAMPAAIMLALKTRDSWNLFRKETLHKLRAEIAVRYINLKGSELREKWKRFFFRKVPAPAQKPANAAVEKNTVRREPDPRLKALFDLKALKEARDKIRAAKNGPPPGNQPPSP